MKTLVLQDGLAIVTSRRLIWHYHAGLHARRAPPSREPEPEPEPERTKLEPGLELVSY